MAKKNNPVVGHIKREPGYMYYADKKGDIRAAKMATRGKKKGGKR